MGSYRSQYQSYYSSLVNNKHSTNRRTNYYPKSNSVQNSNSKLLKRLLRDLVGVFCLLSIILFCKLVKLPWTIEFYRYCKFMVDYSYDYNEIYTNITSLNMEQISETINNYIETIKSGITGESTIKDTIGNSFVEPVKGKIIRPYGDSVDNVTNKKTFHYGIDIEVPVDTEIKSCADGTVKYLGENEEYGKYIIIDHGLGVETKYANLKEMKVEVGKSVKAGEVIATSGSDSEFETPHLHFELIYMADNKDPQEYLKFSSES
ncbi:MAG: M23 family metallopeptidase [Clostridiales bacterium]|uniref:M23 family metallopeptidase n=1 Tax=Clostridium sp. N3C TaxID=1776758 RepID=UPI00092DEFE7|nr:M23 family metallopeptidase [Clostridium sp. N3C]NLZ48525.1 M23 family metallopeptidase [Clostridiales bacterium]SCN21738.1 Septal ring factor [Clostridium sp. N3C]